MDNIQIYTLEPYQYQICDFSSDFYVNYFGNPPNDCQQHLITQTASSTTDLFMEESAEIQNAAIQMPIAICSQPLEPYQCQHCDLSSDFCVNNHQYFGNCPNSDQTTSLGNDLVQEECAENQNPATQASESQPEIKLTQTQDAETQTDELPRSPPTRQKLKRIQHANDIQIQCDKCDFKTSVKSYLKRHLMRKHTPHDQIRWFECDNCDHKTKTGEELKNHMISKHTPDEQMKWHECDKCDHKTLSERYLKRHLLVKHTSHNEIEWFECNNCRFKSKTKQELKTHMISKHTPSELVEWFECDSCDFKDKHNGALKRHKISMHRIKWFQCEQCDYKSKYLQIVRRHVIKTHSKQ